MSAATALLLVAILAAPPVRAAVPSWAVAVLPSGREFALEIAADDLTRARGYMFRERIGPQEGMLFVFEREERHGFWMKNCRLPLDIVWLDERLRVVHLLEGAAPCPAAGDCPTHLPPVPARYVLEFAAGTVRAERLARGQAVVVLSDPALR